MHVNVLIIAVTMWGMLSLTHMSDAQSASNVPEQILIDSEMPSEMRTILAQDLKYLAEVKGSGATPLFKEIFKVDKVDGEQLVLWLSRFIKKIRFLSEEDGVRRGVDVTSISGQAYFSEYVIALTRSWLSRSREDRLIQIFHEAGHLASQSNHLSLCLAYPVRNYRNGQLQMAPVQKFYVELDDKLSISWWQLIWWPREAISRLHCDGSIFSAYGIAALFASNLGRFCVNCDLEARKQFFQLGWKNAGFVIPSGYDYFKTREKLQQDSFSDDPLNALDIPFAKIYAFENSDDLIGPSYCHKFEEILKNIKSDQKVRVIPMGFNGPLGALDSGPRYYGVKINVRDLTPDEFRTFAYDACTAFKK